MSMDIRAGMFREITFQPPETFKIKFDNVQLADGKRVPQIKLYFRADQMFAFDQFWEQSKQEYVEYKKKNEDSKNE
ncbi:MAG: hypothetical protein UT24_C0003G0019 [Candidatus Woesebacteria bacterium GW2011_GWB1_39_12]|uniref:Uncharacterized protein n=1 Tax=Candidatus Woesebacteria bacterium GW2011_GWB1_39_12 TaxID=1618574 RepID=A0A0G0QIW1_9BACT|nr:MAG: hypothetical protein UT24_C0003G0019 [Candidatus Woesebacteria bacterium GW2011_GWB1_39_12]